MSRISLTHKSMCLVVACLLTLSGCASQVVIAKPFHEKLRIGDGIKLTVKDGTIHSGRIVYIDRASVVIRTPKQKTSERPVEVARFGSTILWSEVVHVKVAGTLDSQKKLISNEEIRVNRRTNNRRNLAINVGLLGAGLSFLVASAIQDGISPANIDLTTYRHSQGRAAFWSTFILGTAASLVAGYKAGNYWDRSVSIARIERKREGLRKAAEALADSLNNAQHIRPGDSPLKF